MLKELIKKLIAKKDLSVEEMEFAISDIIKGVNEAQVGAFLTLLSAKGETAEEIYGVVKTMQSMMVKTKIPYPILDIVGTGGDGFNTVNISTGSALLAASCGVKIAKHGNRSVSSMTGSADVLETLGLNIDLSPSQISKCIESCNFGFFYAPNFHPALGKVKLIRKKLGMLTIFNIVGPLLNPCSAQLLMIGVARSSYLKIISEVLIKMKVHRALVFNCQGLDEICSVGPIDLIEINNSKATSYTLDPADYGFTQCAIEELQGGSPEVNAAIIKSALKGNGSPVSDTLILNAGIANYLYGLCKSQEEGIALAKAVHSKGDAYRLLETLILQTKKKANFSEVRHA